MKRCMCNDNETIFIVAVMTSTNKIESHGTLQWDILQLAGHLRQERLFVSAEQQNLQNLNEKVSTVQSHYKTPV